MSKFEAVIWDFGGVVTSSPFEAFNRYESEKGLPVDTIRRINATNPDSNAWARLERNELSPTDFDDVFAEESAALGHRVPGRDVLGLLDGAIRPEMVDLLDRVKADAYTLFMAVPTIYVKLIQVIEAATDADRAAIVSGFKAMRLMVSGSAALPASVHEHWTDSDVLNCHNPINYVPAEVGLNSQWGMPVPQSFITHASP